MILKITTQIQLQNDKSNPVKLKRPGYKASLLGLAITLGLLLGFLNAIFVALPQYEAVFPPPIEFDTARIHSVGAFTPISGWWVGPAQDTSGSIVVRGQGTDSIVAVTLPQAGAYHLNLTLSRWMGGPPQRQIQIYFNQVFLGNVNVPEGAQAQSFMLAVPASAVNESTNTLRFVYSGSVEDKNQPNEVVFHTITLQGLPALEAIPLIVIQSSLNLVWQVGLLGLFGWLIWQIWRLIIVKKGSIVWQYARTRPWLLTSLITVIMLNIFLFVDQDWEILATKHYFGSDWFYYGGYANQFIETKDGLRSINYESMGNLHNLLFFAETRSFDEAQYRVEGYPATERLLTPFLAKVVYSLSFETVGLLSAFTVLNITLWLISIVIAFKLTAIFFEDEFSPYIAAFLIAGYPIFTLMFLSIKVQYIGTVFLLFGIYLSEKYIRYYRAHIQFVYYTALFFLGMFAGGGWLWLLTFLLLRQLWPAENSRLATTIIMFLATVVAYAGLSFLSKLYQLPSTIEQSGVWFRNDPHLLRLIASESWAYIGALLRGQDVSDKWFLNYQGNSFWTGLMPLLLRNFVAGHWLLLLCAAAAFLSVQRTRLFIWSAIPLFLVGHSGTMVTGWLWHYGYLSAPAGVMLILASAGFLGRLSAQGRWFKGLAIAIVLIALIGFMDHKREISLYFSGNYDYTRPTFVYHGDHQTQY